MESNGQSQPLDGVASSAVAESLHHVAIVIQDSDQATRFYVDVLGFRAHPTKPNWLLLDGHGAVHLIELPERERGSERYPMAHLALRVASLEAARDRLLEAGRTPWQNGLDWTHRDISDTSVSLDWGIGTLFVLDPDGNAVELIEPGRGIFALHARD
jgi:catechol 2,3-dioxygenase-like lactoylglutathione lyase family enzyme